MSDRGECGLGGGPTWLWLFVAFAVRRRRSLRCRWWAVNVGVAVQAAEQGLVGRQPAAGREAVTAAEGREGPLPLPFLPTPVGCVACHLWPVGAVRCGAVARARRGKGKGKPLFSFRARRRGVDAWMIFRWVAVRAAASSPRRPRCCRSVADGSRRLAAVRSQNTDACWSSVGPAGCRLIRRIQDRPCLWGW